MKGGLDETALVQPGRPVIGEEAFAQQWAQEAVVKVVLVVAAMVLLEDLFDEIGVVDHVDWPHQEAYKGNISIGAGEFREKLQRVALDRTRARQQAVPSWARWRHVPAPGRCHMPCRMHVRHRSCSFSQPLRSPRPR